MTGKIELPEVPELELAPEKPPQGPLVWMKENLFSTPFSFVLSVFGLLIAYLFVKGMVGFLFDFDGRRWDAVTSNMRLLFSQAYPAGDNANLVDEAGNLINQYHRVWISVGTVVALAMFSLVYWEVGGKVSARKLARVLSAIGASFLFVFLGIAAIDWVLGIVTGLDFGWDFQFADWIHFIFIAIGAGLVALGWGIERLTGDAGKRDSIPVLAIVAVIATAIVGSLWVIKVPVPEEFVVGAPKVWGSIASSTYIPWTILLLVAFASYALAAFLKRVGSQQTGKRILVGLWLLSYPFLAMVVLRDPAWGEEFAEGFNLIEYLLVGAAFIVVGGAIVAATSYPELGEWAAAIAGVVGLLAFVSFLFPVLYFVRIMLFVLLLFAVGAKTFGGAPGARFRYLSVWVASVVLMTAFFIVAKGGSSVPSPTGTPFGGFTLTVLIFLGVTLTSFPLGILLALGRTSTMPIFRILSTGYIEIVRGVPLITWLLISVIFLPFALPQGFELDKVLGVILFYGGFSGAYLAENVRGGLQAIRAGQKEASKALGMNAAQTIIFITLPQALRTVIPALVGGAIATFKDTSLVTLIGLFDFLHISRFVIPQSTVFRASQRTTLLFAAIIYWIFTFAMSRASLRLEKKLGVGER
jgi:general L-amino acid transport system permease protein